MRLKAFKKTLKIKEELLSVSMHPDRIFQCLSSRKRIGLNLKKLKNILFIPYKFYND